MTSREHDETPPPTAFTKAWVGAVLAGLTATATALAPDVGGTTTLTPLEYVTIVIAIVATWGGVALTTNHPKR